jgi:predicted nucleic acid-binding protein
MHEINVETAMIRVYYDTNMIGENAEQNEKENLALIELKKLMAPDGSKRLSFTISNRNRNELDRTTDKDKKVRLHEAAKDLANESNDHKLLGINVYMDRLGTCINSPRIVDVPDEEIFASLRKILPDEMDAQLLTVAIVNHYDVFLTRDHRTILRKRDQVNALFPEIKILKPSELLREFSQKTT